jgi:uncharacterized membrane protein
MDKKTKLSLSLVIGSLLALAYLMLFQKTQLAAFLKREHLLPEEEKLTELYFEDHGLLPAKLMVGESRTVRFTVHNVEYEPKTYAYEFRSDTATASSLLETGSITLEHDESRTVPVSFSMTEATRSAFRVLLLEPKNE